MYCYDPAEKRVMEQSCIPLAVYQFVNRRVRTLALSEGFCRLFGYDRETAYQLMDSDMYRDTHPDDAARVADAGYRFATEGGEYNVTYRTRVGSEYRIIHAYGEHIVKETGDRLAVIWYNNEGVYNEAAGVFRSELNAELKQEPHKETIFQTSYYDRLTGLPNMSHFFQLAEAGRIRILEEGKTPVMLYFDLTGMKYYNRQYGFAEGDKLIRAVGSTLARVFSNGSCSRFGQDHFAAYTDEETLEQKLETLFEACLNLNDGKSLPLRAGVYSERLEEVDAGTACDRAKYACDRYSGSYVSDYYYFDESMRLQLENTRYIINTLDRAIEEKWIKVYYQPIVRAANGRVCDEEALSRWNDPVHGFMAPDQFIPALESSGLIYKLDLYVLEQVLEKLKAQRDAGLYMVPQSLNLSRSDFDSCDIVEEIRRRVDDSGIDRSMLTIEITESMVGSDFDFMKSQVLRFQKLGFRVWMDDFGSGYSSLDVLQSIRFDLIKFDMRFMQQFDQGDESRIILTELVKMALGLGIDTIAEGVETQAHVDFLREIGCTKLQGYFYTKPISLEEIMERYRSGRQIGFENPDETGYFETIGRLNLYDLGSVTSGDSAKLNHYFNTLPMAVLEVKEDRYRIVRCNRSYRDFRSRLFNWELTSGEILFDSLPEGDDSVFAQALLQCREPGKRVYIDDEIAVDGSTIHTLIRHVSTNPVTGIAACVIVVLGVVEPGDRGLTYKDVSQALSADYLYLYYVNLETEHYVEYSSSPDRDNMTMERRGRDFFEVSRQQAHKILYNKDQDDFLAAFTKENVLRNIDENGSFSISYRQIIDGEPLYVFMKAVRLRRDDKHIIIGVSNVDSQKKQKEALERVREEQTTFARIAALSGGYIAIYTVDPLTDRYDEYSSTGDYAGLGFAKTGKDFFSQAMQDSERVIYRADLPRFRVAFSKEKILREIRENGLFVLRYRLMIDGVPRYVNLKAALIEERDGPQLIVGVSNIDAHMRHENPAIKNAPSGLTDFQTYIDRVCVPSCVLSVEDRGKGNWGEIHIVCANKAYREAMGSGYYPGMLYSELVPKDLKFEDFCYRAAILKQRMRAYVETPALSCWTEELLVPLHSDQDGIGYCHFMMEFTPQMESDRAAAVSQGTSSALIRACVALMSAQDFKESVTEVLRDLQQMSDALCARVLLFDKKTHQAETFCEVLRPNDPYYKNLDATGIIPYEVVASWEKTIGMSNCFILHNEKDLEELERVNPVWAASMREYDIKSTIHVPLRWKTRVIGYLYIVNYDLAKTVEVKEYVELLSYFLSAALSSHLLLDRLEQLSLRDLLTGVNNRNAMIRHMDFPVGTPFGIVNIDINGLKFVNDTRGHAAGDRLLVQAAEMLKKIFYAEDIFRTGGDEFIIIARSITRDAFERKLERLKRDEKKNGDVSFALGSFWSDGSVNVKTAFQRADLDMYENKKSFYSQHPELKR